MLTAHIQYSESVPLNEPSGLLQGCDVTTLQSLYSYCKMCYYFCHLRD